MIFEALIIGFAILLAGWIIAKKGNFIILKNETSSGGISFFGSNEKIIEAALKYKQEERARWERQIEERREK